MATTTFWSRALFKKRDQVKIGFTGIAKQLAICERSAKNYIKRDLENNFISKKRSTYIHPAFDRLCDGKNTYFLTEKGKQFLGYLPFEKSSYDSDKNNHPPSNTNNPKQDLEKLKLLLSALAKKEEHEFPHASQTFFSKSNPFPSWWLQDAKLLQKTLNLLLQKIEKGYSVKCPRKWISCVLKQQGIGYRKKVTKDVLKELHTHKPNKEASSFVQNVYARLRHFQKQGLDLSFASLHTLLRKGFSHLGDALSALEKLQSYKPSIDNLNAFISYLVSLDDPHSVYQKRPVSPHALLAKTKIFLSKHKARICFLKKPSDLPLTPHSSQTYLQFLMNKNDPMQSLLKTFHFLEGKWQEKILSLKSPQFYAALRASVNQ